MPEVRDLLGWRSDSPFPVGETIRVFRAALELRRFAQRRGYQSLALGGVFVVSDSARAYALSVCAFATLRFRVGDTIPTRLHDHCPRHRDLYVSARHCDFEFGDTIITCPHDHCPCRRDLQVGVAFSRSVDRPPRVEDLFAFHKRKSEERAFPLGNAKGRDRVCCARESCVDRRARGYHS